MPPQNTAALGMVTGDAPSLSVATESIWQIAAPPTGATPATTINSIHVETNSPGGYGTSAKLSSAETCLRRAPDILANLACANLAANTKINPVASDGATALGTNNWGLSLDAGSTWRIVPPIDAATDLTLGSATAAAKDKIDVIFGITADYLIEIDTYQTTVLLTTISNLTTIPIPEVTTVSPDTGSIIGGTLITIEGSGFMVNGSVVVNAVKIGANDCLEVDIASNTKLTCITPPHLTEGPANITVSTWGGISELENGFTYGGSTVPEPSISTTDDVCTATLTSNQVIIDSPIGTTYYRINDETNWTKYTAPLTITETTTIYAKTIEAGQESEVTDFIALVAERTNEKFICTEADLRSMADHLDWTYFVANNIDLTSAWTPLTSFAGKFHGRDHTIDNLNFTATTANRGFISTISAENVIIEKITFTNIAITANIANKGTIVGTVDATNFALRKIRIESGAISGNTSTANIGGLIGTVTNSDGSLTITDSYVGINITGRYYLGGLVGNVATGKTINIARSGYGGTITEVSSASTATANDGGLIGHGSNATITDCYMKGSIVATATGATAVQYIGGIAGHLEGVNTLSGIDMTGTITGRANVGGLVGYLPASGNTISDALITGTVTGSNNVGGVVGYAIDTGNTISDIVITSEVTGATYVGGVIGNAAVSGTTIKNIDFTSDKSVSATAGYVGGIAGHLTGDNQLSNITVNLGTPITGTTYISGLVGNSTGSLTVNQATIDVSITATAGYVGGVAGYTVGATLSEITVGGGEYKVSSNYVGGLIGHNTNGSLTIKNVTLAAGTITHSTTSTYVGGLVGYVNGTSSLEIENLQTERSITGTGGSSRAGLIGYLYNSTYDTTITNCQVKANIAGGQYTGGLIGRINRTSGYDINITGCSYEGEITATSTNVGGLTGGSNTTVTGNLIFKNSTAKVKITGATGTIGGFAGYNAGTSIIENCSANVEIIDATVASVAGFIGNNVGTLQITGSSTTGNITTASTYAGGLVGYTTAALTIANSHSAVNITSTSTGAGGLVGTATTASSISESFATGNITATGIVGGLAGLVTSPTIDKSYATGNVTATSTTYAGGLAGQIAGANSTVKDSYATGNVNGLGYAAGLIGALAAGNNNTVQDSYATGNVSGTTYVGGLIGSASTTVANGGVITRSYARGNVTGTSTCVGGLIGYSTSAISKVYASGNVTNNLSATAVTGTYTGGLIGRLNGSATLTDAYALGDVITLSAYTVYIGGLLGQANTSTNVTNAYSAGSVSYADTGTANINAVIGNNASSALTNLYWIAETSMIWHASADVNATMLSWASTPLTDYLGFDTDIWGNQDGITVPYLQDLTIDPKNYITSLKRYNFDGSGTLADPYQIKNETDLAHVYTTPSAHFKVMNDFTVTQSIPTIPQLIDGGIDGAGHTITGFTNSGQGLIATITNPAVYIKDLTFDSATITGTAVVIGTLAVTGDYTLNNVNVTNSTITSTTENTAALIGTTTSNSTHTLTISNCQISATISGTTRIGGLVGYSNRSLTIENCHYAGDLTASGTYAGGLVGRHTSYDLQISNSYSTGNISALGYAGGLVGNTAGSTIISDSYSSSNIAGSTSHHVGGLVGAITSSTQNTISRVYATGTITAPNAQNTGGLVGSIAGGTITTAYASGNVTGSGPTGGLVGTATNATITDVYALGDVTGTTNVGGLIGSLSAGSLTNAYAAGTSTVAATIGTTTGSPTINNLYWQVDTSHIQSDSIAQPIRTLYSPTSAYVGFDFNNGVWDMTAGSTIPYLQDLGIDNKNYITTIRKYPFAGQGLAASPYLISTKDDFDEIRNNQHAYYQLTADIDLTGLSQIPDFWYGGLDGQNHTLSNFTLPLSTQGGLFATLSHEGVTIKNLTLSNFALSGTANYRGLITNQISAPNITLDAITVENGTINTTSTTRDYYGGLIANVTATGGVTIKNCAVDVTISNRQYTGGLIGAVTAGGTATIENCAVTGSITATSTTSNAGGLIGYAPTAISITDSSFTGTITAAATTGGLVGTAGIAGTPSTISNSHVNATITTTGTYVGGLVGNAINLAITGSTTTSSQPISGTNYLGGLVGQATTSSTITQSSSDISISGQSYLGGLVGSMTGVSSAYGSISNSYATGNITATAGLYVGGLGGNLLYTSITDSYATGDVTATAGADARIGGLAGYVTYGPTNRTFASGNVSVTTSSGTSSVGGLIGINYRAPVSESYASGNVSCTGTLTDQRIGGLIGYNYHAAATLNDVYALGNVSSAATSVYLGGLVGYLYNNASINRAYTIGKVTEAGVPATDKSVIGTKYTNTTVTDIYWLTATSGVFTDPYATPIYLPTAPITDYTGFDTTTIWDNQDGLTVPYFQNVTLDPKNYISNLGLNAYEGQGTQSDPYLIKTAADLDAIRENPFAHYKVNNDIDMTTYGAIIPIPTLTGTIDGNHKTISNLSLTSIGTNTGLIATISADTATIKDLTLADISYAAGSYTNTGGLIGSVTAPNFTISNVNLTSGQITSTGANLGGLIGAYTASSGTLTINGCDISATLSGRNYLGGIVGQVTTSSELIITDCTFSGTMIGSAYDYHGAMAGSAGKITMTNITVTGTVGGDQYVGGLVGSTQGGSIQDVVVSGPDLETSGTFTGGLVGYNETADLNISSVIISKNIISAGAYTGGLIGQAYSGTTAGSQITHAIMNGNITATAYTGGLIGSSVAASQISNSYVSSDITHAAGTDVGGLIGVSIGDTIRDVFTLVTISGTGAPAGGLIGNAAVVTITNAHTTVKLSSPSSTRQATIGTQSSTTVTNTYWNVEASNIFDDTAGQPIATLYTPASAYVGFDFTTVWGIVQDSTTSQYTFPYLQDLAIPEKSKIDSWIDYDYTGKGLATDPYLINNITDLNNVRNNPHAYYRVTTDLTLTDAWSSIPKVYAGGIDGQNHTLSDLTVAATSTATNGFINAVAGDYHLHDWKIANFTTTGNYAQKGFIATATAGTLTIANLSFIGGAINPATAQTNTGTLIGQVSGATTINISNIDSNLSIKGTTNTGGLIGNLTSTATATLSDIQFTGTLTTTGSGTGGIIGTITSGTVTLSNITQSSDISSTTALGGYIGQVAATATAVSIDGGTMTGNITGTGTNIGGIIGASAPTTSTTLKNLTINTTDGAIIGTSNLGGAIGYASAGDLIVENVHSNYQIGDAIATTYTGGLIGRTAGAYNTTITNSSATGNVTGTDYTGGLAGSLAMTGTTATTVKNSFATGNVTSTGNYAGGLAGRITNDASSVELSYATGNVTSTGINTAGLIGQNYATLSKVYASGDVTNTNPATAATALYVGGLIGYHYTSPITDAFAVGNVSTPAPTTLTYIGGLVGRNSGTLANIYYGGILNGTINTPTTRQILVGSTLPSTTTGAYWYSDISGYTGTATYATPVTKSSPQSDFAFNFTDIWDMQQDVTMPYLRGLPIDNKVKL
jgi:hypothetical protein